MSTVALAQPSLVALHPAQSNHTRLGHGLSQSQGLFVGATACAVARDAQLQQHIPATRLTAPCAPVGQGSQLRQRIDQKPDTRLWVLVQQQVQTIQVGVRHQLVGDDGALCACGQAHTQLVHIGKSQAPGPGLQLHPKQLGRHRGLPVRGQGHPFALHKGLHPSQVVRKRRAAQHGHRVCQCILQQVPAALAQRGHGAGLGGQGVAFAARVQYKITADAVVVHHLVCLQQVADAGSPLAMILPPPPQNFRVPRHPFLT